jgi:DNA-binding GntR family transcriptional regulator
MPDFRTETQKVADELMESILSGDYLPGERLPQRNIAEKYGTTTIVAREALRAVAAQGLVLIEPRYGAVIEEVTSDRLRERYIVREALESMAARLAAERMDPDEVKRLTSLAEECDRELPGSSLSRREKAKLHIRLHEYIAEVARCGELQRLLNGIYLHSMIVSNAYHIDWAKDEEGWHSILIEPIVARVPERADALMRRHVRRGLEMELSALQRSG